MAGAKRDSKLARRFISRLAKELVSDSESGFRLASSTQDLKVALRKSADSLPPGKLRSTLQLILEDESEQEAFNLALQIEIRALSAKLELHGDVLLTSTASERLFETLLNSIDGKANSSFTDATGSHVFSHEEIQLLLARDPAPHILWALAAVKFTYTDGTSASMKLSTERVSHLNSSTSSFSASASALLHCLKPWIVDRDASVAMVTMAPVVPLIFESLQQASRNVSNMKTLRTLVKEVLSFIVAVNYKEHFTKGFAKNDSRGTLSFPALLDGFFAVFKAFELQGTNTQKQTSSIIEKLDRMFPLASECTRNALKPPGVRIGLLADIVKSEFLLLYMVLEVLYCRQKSKDGGRLVKNQIGILGEQVGRIAVDGLAAGQTDLILNTLLSDMSSLNNLLDEEEKSLVCASIFKAVLLNSYCLFEKNIIETSSRSRKALEGFMKRIAVARKIATRQRTKCDNLDNITCYLKVPPKLVDYLRSHPIRKSLLEKGTLNDRALIGWLVQLEDTDFQALLNGTAFPGTQADEKMSPEKVDVGNAKRLLSSEVAHDQAEPEDLFFLDTTGEEQSQDAPAAIRQSEKSKKRKAKRVVFHRQGRVIHIKEDGDLSEGSSDSSDSRDNQSVVNGKRRNREGSPAPTIDDYSTSHIKRLK